ncbi:Flagellar motor rotation protein MotB [Acidisarcina polymorpha]|uniref:Flagellar motor rotation protein MotB n=1 Tax=Acidisarcina polymorpha TaxID=2211140 RepID=A0A2Z5G2J0_9BACT|nr:flagellar motor protein MotB [Acidisarcina polymorpha]AXC12875.1 Flagellar motor rotation protein MotB [Acidisarcina polymorpha]
MAKPTIIIIKRGKGHAGHHGGAWKVAYADFVTAMMALFIVLWLLNTSEHTKKVVAGYFNDPLGKSTEVGSDKSGSGEALPFTKENIEKLKEQLERQIHQTVNLKDLSKQVEMTVTPEGLRIELLESKDGTFFDLGGTTLKPDGKDMLNLLADKLSTVPNRVSIEGHTDSQPFSGAKLYSNWELSEDRANVARRLMQHPGGLRENQVSQVRGFANQRLRMPAAPFDPSNRRVSLIVQYLTPADLPAQSAAAVPSPNTNPTPSSATVPAKTPGSKPTAGH